MTEGKCTSRNPVPGSGIIFFFGYRASPAPNIANPPATSRHRQRRARLEPLVSRIAFPARNPCAPSHPAEPIQCPSPTRPPPTCPISGAYARALTGSQKCGRPLRAAMLEAVLADPALGASLEGGRVALYRAFSKIWARRTAGTRVRRWQRQRARGRRARPAWHDHPPGRQALLPDHAGGFHHGRGGRHPRARPCRSRGAGRRSGRRDRARAEKPRC